MGNKTVLYLISNCITVFLESKAEQPLGMWTANSANKRLVLHV